MIAFSCAGGTVNFEDHCKAIQAASHLVTPSSRPEVEILPKVTRESLARRLDDASRPITVLHLLCHGATLRNDAYGVMINPIKELDEHDRLDASDLRRIVSICATPPRFVILCVCQSGDTGKPAHRLGSIAQMLHRQGIPAVLSSRMPLSGDGSLLLTEVLYGELISGSGNLRKALSAARIKLMRELKSKDWASLQLYAREGDDAALEPFRRPAPPAAASPRGDLVLVCHEAYSKVYGAPEAVDAPALFGQRHIRTISIDQTPALEGRQWEHLDAEVRRLASPQGDYRKALAERDTELVYYGFPFVPLAALAGYLAKTRHVHVFEHDRELKRFTWVREAVGPFPPLKIDAQSCEGGSAARLRLSISAPVGLDDCRQVLPDQDLRLDLHFRLEDPQRGIVRREEQVQEYARQIRQALDQYVARDHFVRSIHVFAAVPVSIAFHLGQAFAASWLPACSIYNHGQGETPRYKWRLWLQAAASEQPSVDIL